MNIKSSFVWKILNKKNKALCDLKDTKMIHVQTYKQFNDLN